MTCNTFQSPVSANFIFRAYSLREISPKSDEFKKAGKDLDVLTSQILENALKVTNVTDKSLARILHDVSGFKEVRSCPLL